MSATQTAEAAYDALAFAYDELTETYCHDEWTARLEELAAAQGLRGRQLLDVACGTGKSFLPFQRRGWSVTASDLSEGMLRRAAAKAPGARLVRADMRDLPRLGRFDLVTCLDDSLNYLLAPGELRAALGGIARNLAPGGVAVWDLNTTAMYRGAFASSWAAQRGELFLAWRGSTPTDLRPGELGSVSIDVFAPESDGTWRRSSSAHVQRHWTRPAVERLATEAGLSIVAVRGQLPGAVLEDDLDDDRHTKAVYVAIRCDSHNREEVSNMIGSP